MASQGDVKQDRPVGGYGVLTGGYFVAVAGFLLRARAGGVELPDRIAPLDLIVFGIATHKASRLIARGKVAEAVRSPFAEYEGEAAAPIEVESTPRGSGLRKAVGELLICPYCLAQWIATALAAGLTVAPRMTRFVAGVFTVVTVSDFLQVAYRLAGSRLQD